MLENEPPSDANNEFYFILRQDTVCFFRHGKILLRQDFVHIVFHLFVIGIFQVECQLFDPRHFRNRFVFVYFAKFQKMK